MQFTYTTLQNNLITWANQQEDIYALILIGSRTSTTQPNDEFSDFDVILYTPNDKKYANQEQWLKELGPFWFSHLDHTHLGEPEQFAMYEGALKLDVLLTHIEEHASLQSCFDDSPHHMVLSQGFKVLLDKTDSKGNVHLPHLPVPKMVPNQIGFKNELSETLFAAIKVAQFIKRGEDEQFRANSILNGSLRRRLLIMLEWDAMARSTADTWYEGRFINQWADPYTRQYLPQIFGAYQLKELKLALQTFIQVYLRLASKVALTYSLEISDEEFGPVINWLITNMV